MKIAVAGNKGTCSATPNAVSASDRAELPAATVAWAAATASLGAPLHPLRPDYGGWP